jgi:hypothetical protein
VSLAQKKNPARAKRVRILILVSIVAVACKLPGTLAAAAAGGDSSCDRRSGASDSPQPFCQEILETVAGSRFREDCTQKLKGTAREDKCPRDNVIAGCKVTITNDDGSEIIDWFYNVDKDPNSKVKAEDRIRTRDQVRAKCNQPGLYEGGATFVEP